ncbi:hypothetical protein [Dyadobacter sp. 32]|uniref:hypothetical protein n=1 Tax=Dyadobacter sp. 32 TaxID=538966 RepID=UPI0011EEF283
MKRRQMLRLLGLAPPVFLVSCRDSKVPSAPTIVTGKVTDEHDMPIEGALIRMFGTKRQGLSGVGTFSTEGLTHKDGNYTLSYVVPRGTDFVNVSPKGTSTINDQTHDYSVQMNGVGSYVQLGSSPVLHWGDYGKTTTINFQYKKR